MHILFKWTLLTGVSSNIRATCSVYHSNIRSWTRNTTIDSNNHFKWNFPFLCLLMKYNVFHFFHKDKTLVFAFNTGFPNSPCSWIYLFHHSFTSAHQFMHYSSPFPLLSVCIFNFRQFCTLAIFHTISCISIRAKKKA